MRKSKKAYDVYTSESFKKFIARRSFSLRTEITLFSIVEVSTRILLSTTISTINTTKPDSGYFNNIQRIRFTNDTDMLRQAVY